MVLMGTYEVKRNIALGFLTVVDHPQYGLFGGYLLLSTAGRPLEFHCTAPIKPNRAQQILYGPTLESCLYGEQIGRTLLEKASVEASLVCTDREAVLAVREHVSLPVALVLAADGRAPEPGGEHLHLDPDRPAHRSGTVRSMVGVVGGGLTTFQVGRNRLAVPEQSDGDRRQIVERLACLPESFDLAEPFSRIRAAIEEAQQAVRSPSGTARAGHRPEVGPEAWSERSAAA
jgi:hypothetical protein